MMARHAALVALGLVVVSVIAISLRGGDTYELVAQFRDAGRLVKGGEVRMAGVRVGQIAGIDVTPDGLADVTLRINADDAPLPRGTTAGIRTVGAATLTNNFVELRPGAPRAPSLTSGAILPAAGNRGLVDVDAVLNAFDDRTRGNLRDLIGSTKDVFAGSGAPAFNAMLAKLAPAMGEFRPTLADLASDGARLDRLISSAGVTARVLSARRADLTQAISNTAVTMQALASQREPLDRLLLRAPTLLRSVRTTSRNLTTTLRAVRPALRDVPATGRRLRPFLTKLDAFLPDALPVGRQLRAQLPDVRRTLTRLPALRGPAVASLDATTQAMGGLRPILRGLRFYAPDFLIGLFNGLLTIGSGNYNKYGHYLHISFVASPQDLAGGPFAGVLAQHPLLPGVLQMRTGIKAPCPGGAAPPAPDHSNPWVADPKLCDPADDMPASVNQP